MSRPKIGGEVGQAGHELLFGTQQLDRPHLALHPAIANFAGIIGGSRSLGQECQESRIEDLVALERGKRRGIGRNLHSEADPGPRSCANRNPFAAYLNLGSAGIHPQLQAEPVAPIE